MGSEPGVGVPASASFAQALDTLKREGSNILLVGDVEPGPRESACHRLLGDSSTDSRFRLFVTTDPSRVEATDDVESAYLVQRPADSNRARQEYPTTNVTETTMLGVLGTEFVETVDEFEAESGTVEPSELRVCVDSVSTLLQTNDSENVFRLLHVMTTRIRQISGMGHYHLPAGRDEEAVRLLEPLFDAVVEIRAGDQAEHRWHLRDTETTTDWITL